MSLSNHFERLRRWKCTVKGVEYDESPYNNDGHELTLKELVTRYKLVKP